MKKLTPKPTEPDTVTKVTLSVIERIHFQSIMPQTGSIVEMELVESLNKRIELTPKETEEIGLQALPDGRIAWNPAKASMREFRFENFEITLIQEGIDALDKGKKIQPFNLELAKRFKAIVVKKKVV